MEDSYDHTNMPIYRKIFTLLAIYIAIEASLAAYVIAQEEIASSTIIISEVLPNPEGTDSGNEFIELYNTSDETIDVSGMTLDDESGRSTYTFPENTQISPKSAITLFNSADFTFALNNTGDTIFLRDAAGTLIDTLVYTSSEEGLSWNAGNPQSKQDPTPGAHSAQAEDPENEESDTSDNTQTDTSQEDSSSDAETSEPSDETAEEAGETPEAITYSPIYLSEIFPNPEGADTEGEFIELYNPNPESIALKDWTISDASANGSYTFADQEIPASSYLAIQRDVFGFALNNSGEETVTLQTPAGDVYASITYSDTKESESFAHTALSDETSPQSSLAQWRWTTSPTPGEANIISTPQQESPQEEDLEDADATDSDTSEPQNENDDTLQTSYLNLQINEVLPNPEGADTFGEYIELYNPHPEDIDLKNWTLSDSSQSGSYIFDQNILIKAENYQTLFRSDFGFALNNTGEEVITLTNPNSEVSDTLIYSDATEGLSFDGENYSATLTPNSPNITSEKLVCEVSEDQPLESEEAPKETEEETDEQTPQNEPDEPIIYPEVILSEIFPNPEGTDAEGEFIELYNPGQTVVSLENWTLSDSSTSSHILGEADQIQPGGFLVLKREDFTFALNNTEEETVTLTNPNGTVASSHTYTETSENYSIAYDQGSWSQTSTPTPGETNVITAQTAQEPTEETAAENQEPTDETPEEPKKLEILETYPNLIISELLPNPDTESAYKEEFIELYNPNETELSLEGWVLKDASKSGSHTLGATDKIPAKSYLVIPKETFKFALNNTGEETVTLLSPNGDVIHSHTYTETTKSYSIAYDQGSWSQTSTPTPGETNVITAQTAQEPTEETAAENQEPTDETPEEPKKLEILETYPNLIISELLPNPDTESAYKEEFIELYNPNETELSLEGWVLKDASKTGSYTLKSGDKISAKSYLSIPKEVYKFALNNSGGESLTLLAPNGSQKDQITYSKTTKGSSLAKESAELSAQLRETTSPTPGNTNIFTGEASTDSSTAETPEDENPTQESYLAPSLSEFLPNPEGSDADGEFIELYNPHTEAIPLENWVLADKSSKYTLKSGTAAPESYFVIYSKDFTISLNNTGEETISLYDPNGTIRDTITYAGSEEDTSYIFTDQEWVQTTSPTPGSANAYTITQTEKDSPENSDESLDLQDSYTKIYITEFLPNPDKDSANNTEFIELYNPHAKQVHLHGWTLKDASKSGSHTFTEDAAIDPGEYLTISKEVFKFALNNSGDESITLLNPLGRISDQTSYTSSNKGVSYGWTGSAWRQTQELTPGKENIFGEELIIEEVEIDNPYRKAETSFEVKISGNKTVDVKYKWDFGNGKKSTKEKPGHTYKKSGEYFGSVTVDDGIETVTKQFTAKIKKYPKRKVEITEIMPNPEGKDSGNEYIVITNNDKKKVKLKDWSIATGKDEDSLKNHPFKKSITLKPGKSKMITKKHASISLNNSAGAIELRLPDGRDVDDVSYDYETKKTIPENSVYRKNGDIWTWDNTTASQAAKSTNKNLSQQEIDKLISQAIANTRPQKTLSAEETSDDIEPRASENINKSLWQKIKQKTKDTFSRNAESKAQEQSYNVPKNLPQNFCKKNAGPSKLQEICL